MTEKVGPFGCEAVSLTDVYQRFVGSATFIIRVADDDDGNDNGRRVYTPRREICTV